VLLGFLLFVATGIHGQTLPNGVQKITSIEGITEYAFPNVSSISSNS
jgi:hypothetical protein